MARALQWNDKWVLKTPGFSPFAPTSKVATAGTLIQIPALAATLRRIGAEGKSAFYEGVIAADVLATARDAGSRMTEADLKGYQVKERQALQTTWDGHEVFTMPPPSAGGFMMLQTLHMHSRADLKALGYGTGAYTHLLAETFRGAIADRLRSIGDPAFVKMDIPALVSRERMKARRAQISMDATKPAESFTVNESGTSHLVAVDAEGNVVSITSTINNMFGAKIVTKSGFLLNDELDDFTKQDLESRFGAKSRPNSPRGGARPVSSMTPTIVVKDGRAILALGGSGGTRIATGTTQVLLAHLVFDRPVRQAVSDPRLETPATGGLLLDSAAPPEVTADLVKRGQVVDSSKPNFSAVQAISIRDIEGIRVIEAGGDPRKGGEGMVD
jgi:gamma-glutamyltranspeptidase/glutathione hydrolase